MTVRRYNPYIEYSDKVLPRASMEAQLDGSYVEYHAYASAVDNAWHAHEQLCKANAQLARREVSLSECLVAQRPQPLPAYQSLQDVLDAAYGQAAHGKGKERHARGNPFEQQHMQSISRLLGTDRGMAFQAIKKLTEGLDMTDAAARERELLGAIVYIAGILVSHAVPE